MDVIYRSFIENNGARDMHSVLDMNTVLVDIRRRPDPSLSLAVLAVRNPGQTKWVADLALTRLAASRRAGASPSEADVP